VKTRCLYAIRRSEWSKSIPRKPDKHYTSGWVNTLRNKPIGHPQHHRYVIWEQLKRREARKRGLL